jgi:hypothetical protein
MPKLIKPAAWDVFIAAVSDGSTVVDAAKQAGFTNAPVNDRRKRDAEFAQRLAEARAAGKLAIKRKRAASFRKVVVAMSAPAQGVRTAALDAETLPTVRPVVIGKVVEGLIFVDPALLCRALSAGRVS